MVMLLYNSPKKEKHMSKSANVSQRDSSLKIYFSDL